MLTAIICIPLLVALVLAFIPANFRFLFRIGAIAATFVTMVLATLMFWQFEGGISGYQFEHVISWVKDLDIITTLAWTA